MVTRETTPAPIAARGAAAPNVLRRKLWRDIRRAAMQFLTIVLLCALGTWVFSGLDGTWRMIENSYDAYFEECSLADLWVNSASLSNSDLKELANLTGVETVQARFTCEMNCPDLGDDVSLKISAYDGEPVLNTPLLQDGELLQSGDKRGILLEQGFAEAHGLGVGSVIKLDVLGTETNFYVRGIVLSAENLVLTKDLNPDFEHYSFGIIDRAPVRNVAFNEALIAVSPDADAADVESAVQELLPEALILDHHSQTSAQRANAEVTIFKSLSYVFPLMAFAVAAMVVLFTLMRMIENQRLQIGCLKALGFSNRKIRAHYLSYALAPSLFGSLLGLFVGRYTLPDILFDMISAHYIMPYRVRAPISLITWIATASMVALSLCICLYAFARYARENTASLLRSKPPRAGSRVLLERMTRLWNRFSFNTKMIVRNIARNKSRTLLAILGLLCCNMLIICAMGLQNSIDWSIGTYYKNVLAYDRRVELENGGTLESYQSRLDADVVEGAMEKSVSLRTDGHSRTVILTILESDQTLLHLCPDQTSVPLPEDGLTISNKLADVLGLSVGDTAEIWLSGDDEPIPFTVAMIVPTNIGQTAYLARDTWEALHKGEFRPTALFIKGASDICLHELDEMDEAVETKFPEEQYDDAISMMDSTKTTFNLMYFAALGLAFVICYNMGLMNYTERTRDYATLKVLGYHQREIRRLIMRENDLITVVGALLGVAPGILLTRVVLSTVDLETMLWKTHILPSSVLIATLITCAFSILLELLITRKVPSINMVEALKSVE